MNENPHVMHQNMDIRHHAVLFGLFARNGMQLAGDSGRDAIRAAVQTYGMERGRRMARRTREDGVEPSVMSYFAYGEWKAADGQMVVKNAAMSPVFQTKVYSCIWHEVWKEYDLADVGHLYCENIDGSLVEGYLGSKPLEIKSFLSLHDSCCHFLWNGFNRTPENDSVLQKLKERVGTCHLRGFDYHTAHLYFTFSKELKARLGTIGGQIIHNTADDFKSLFTEEVYNHILSFQKVDFSQSGQ